MNLTIGKKLTGSFLILSLLVLSIGLTGLITVNKADVVMLEKMPFKDVATKAIISADRAVNACRNYLLSETGLSEIKKEINEYIGDFEMLIAMVKYGTESDEFKNSPAGKMYVKDGLNIKVPRGTDEMLALIDEIGDYQSVFIDKAGELMEAHNKRVQYSFIYDGVHYDLSGFLYAADVKHRRWFEQLHNAVEYEVDFIGEFNHAKCFFGAWQTSYKSKDKELTVLLDKFQTVHVKLHEVGRSIMAAEEEHKESMLQRGIRYATKVQQGLDKLQKYAEAKIEETEKQEQSCVNAMFEASEKMAESLEQLEEIADNDMNLAQENAKRFKNTSVWILTILMSCAVFLALTLGFLVTRSIARPLKRAIDGLSEGAGQIVSASGQVSSASQSLAEGSSEQAASIEETSSSLEEMSSMTKQNADNAGQADNLMKQASHAVADAESSMTELTTSMKAISSASDETQKVVKTIDEIAFQTNLLALNAAVEAARAGEAGAGFAVVADEVRNLALRSADAAKNTAELIEGTVKKVKGGSYLVERTSNAFTKVAENSSKVGELIAEVTIASNEQAQGIEQTNTAVAEMDNVTQQNAANAEESASASEELNAQAEQIMEIVGELSALVGGAANDTVNWQQTLGRKHRIKPQKVLLASVGRAKVPAVRKTKPEISHGAEVRPDQIIPLDDKDF